ncbi:SURF1 family protein [Arthrobacter sp. N199823]|uniref:SURF1 family protein n=1 Tax=Arthrobacter sp. N199823 TaxID=2058895 RepID=UPI000CE357A6|nr:SURF1 family protein [Arthrobacter sp. N199823]
MLKTALRPKWIAALLFALVVAAVLVLLSQWQLSRSLEKDVAPPSVTEKVQPLLETMRPGLLMTGDLEGQLVTTSGHFDANKQVLVPSRIENGQVGYWVVTAFVVDGAPKLEGVAATKEVVIPVARGWIATPDEAAAAPGGTLTIEGRLLNTEGPEVSPNLPDGQISTLSTSELTNLWNVSTYAAFIVSHEEVQDGANVGASASAGTLTPITVTATDQNNKVNWLNIFYAIEWVVFAGFALFLWWRLVADEYRREQDELFDIDHGNDDDNDDVEPDGDVDSEKQLPTS